MRSSTPLVSIVTPSFEQGRFLAQTLRSVRSQTYRNLEHIVIDGGSADETLSILRQHEGSYNLRWISEPDGGMYDAINKGLAMARGEVLAYLNSDDLYFPWSVELAVSHLRRHPASAIVYGDAVAVADSTRAQRILFQPPFRKSYLLTIGSFAQPAVFWKRAVTDEVGSFDRGLQYAGDLDFFIRAAAKFGAERIDEVLAVMRIHPSMKTVTGVGRIRTENANIRRRLAGREIGRATVLLERARAWCARRRLALSFAFSYRGRGRSGTARPWGYFLSADGLSVSIPKLVLSMLPLLGARPAVTYWLGGVDWLDDRSRLTDGP